MKKILTMLFGLAALTMNAQTEASPFVLHEGEQTITGLSSWSTVYMSYEAPTDQLVSVIGIQSSFSITVGEENVPVYYDSTEKENCFMIPAGTTYSWSYFYMGSDSEIAVTVRTKEQSYTKAQTCETAIEATEAPFFVPFVAGSGFMAPAEPVYIKYTPDIDGKLTMHFSYSVSNLKYAKGCSGDYISLTGDYANGGWEATLEVDADTEYIFQGTSSSAMMANFVTKVPLLGASCADAANMKKGANELPAEAGSYWFTFITPQTPEKCFVTLTTDADLTGGYSTISSGCSSSYGNITQQGTLHQRILMNKGTSRILEINKATALDAPATVALNFEMEQEYDSFSTAPEIPEGETETTPDFGGTYYYSVVAPETGNYFLEVESLLENAPSGLRVEIFSEDNDYFSKASGITSVRYNITAGMKYIIKWTCPDNVCSMPFKVELTEVKKGETANDPIIAEIGENQIPASSDIFFLYTATSDSWLTVTPHESSLQTVISTVESAGSAPSIVQTYEENGGFRFEGIDGKNYQIEFKGASEGSSFTLATREYAVGETQGNPIIAGNDPVALPDEVATTWIRYTAEEEGIVDVSTTATYAPSNMIRVYLGEVSANESKALTPGTDDGYNSLSYNLKAGDELNVSVKISPAQVGKVISFTPREPNPGEYPSSAIAIDFSENPMTYLFDKTVGYSDAPVWYSINLSKGIFNLETEKSITMYLYSPENTDKEIAQSSGSMFGPNKIENASIPVPGTYYLKLVYCSAPFTATLSERDANEGETPANAIKIIPDEEPYTTTMGASEYAMWYEIELQEGIFNLIPEPSASVELYDSDNFTTPVVKAVMDWSTYKYAIKDFTVTTAGKYYVKMPASISDIEMTLSGTSIVVNTQTGIGSIVIGNEKPVYYNLEGIQVDEPKKGIYIRVVGNKSEKIVIR